MRERKGVLSVWAAGQQVFEIEKRPRSQESVPHAEQWQSVPSTASTRRAPTPLGHLQPVPQVAVALQGVRPVLWSGCEIGGVGIKQGAYQLLHLSHLEAALPQVVQAAQREQWTYETFLQRALAAELDKR